MFNLAHSKAGKTEIRNSARMTLAQGFTRDRFTVFLALFTMLVAIIGRAIYTSAAGLGSAGLISDLVGLAATLPSSNIFVAFNSLGALQCEISLIILGLKQVTGERK